ncbi:hypothetical protein [Novosphingobium sp. EMRT-2]|uniref:phage tail terminator protein n=1 Tax=Novosphingobium sp. EMRT-2 TaxID=2571749 RepID=UPI0010BD48AE|nr:hypothetical protein [Novosphingobium sp. EMRT-2]QCI93265.1 hypothetical protein FA702_06650 [Novosphingobium sp. EMRT-2]
MIAQAPIVARLLAAGFNHAEGVLEFAGLSEAPRVSPALFVVPERESAGANTLGAGAVDQKITEIFNVVVVVRTERRPGAVNEALGEAIGAVETALAGWMHPDASSHCQIAGGRLLSTDGQRVAWAMSFSVSRHFRKVSQ